MKTAWCIQHEHSVLVQNSVVGELHEIWGFNEFGQLDISWCDFPSGWATCPPPDEEIDWQDHLTNPSEDEVIVMDSEANNFFSSSVDEVIQYERNFPYPF